MFRYITLNYVMSCHVMLCYVYVTCWEQIVLQEAVGHVFVKRLFSNLNWFLLDKYLSEENTFALTKWNKFMVLESVDDHKYWEKRIRQLYALT